MKTQLRLLLLLGALALSALPAAGCGGVECGSGTKEKDGTCVSTGELDPDGDGITCGEGTKLVSGKCVAETRDCAPGTVLNSQTGLCDPVSEDNCGPKTVMNPDGRCVIAADACAGDETLDPNTGDCIPGGAKCGTGTALEAGTNTCVPTEEVCDGGTVFNEETGLCLPGETCKAGDVLLNGLCVTSAEELASRADLSETENNDPALGGTAEVLTLKDPGSSTVFTGTISEPTDLDADEVLDQDLDVFTFEATGGQWFQLAVQSTGLPSPAFIIEGPEDYLRVSPLIGDADPARQFVAPLDGTYSITVLPAAALYADGPFGQDDWSYVGSLEEISASAPTGVSLLNGETISGDYTTPADNFFTLTGFNPGDIISLSIDNSGQSASGLLQRWASPTLFESESSFDEGDSIELLVPPSGEVLVLIDADIIDGPSTSFDISGAPSTNAQALGILGDNDTVSSTPVDIARQTVFRYTFSVSAGQVIDISVDHSSGSYDTVDMTLKNSAGQTIFVGDSIKPGGEHGYFYSEQGGTFLLEFTPHYSTDDLSDVVATIATITPNDLGSATIGDSIYEHRNSLLENGKSEFHILTLTDAVLATGAFTSDNDEDIDVYFYDPSMSLIRSFTTSGAETISDTILDAGTVLIRVEAQVDTPAYEIQLDFADAPQMEVEPNDTQAEATPIDISQSTHGTSEGTSDLDFYSFSPAADLAAGEVFIVQVELLDSGSDEFICTLLDSTGNVIGINDANGIEKGCVSMATGLLAAETYYLEIERDYGSSSKAYAINSRIENGVLEVEPNDTAATATPFTLDVNTQLYGHVPLNTDTDYFSFELTSAMAADEYFSLSLEEIGFRPTTGATWQVLDNAGTVLASASYTDALEFGGLDAGTYHLVISRTNSTGFYSLAYKITATVETSFCGNDIVEPGEQCDGTGNCSAFCEIIPPTESLTNADTQILNRAAGPVDFVVTATQCSTVAAVTVDIDLPGQLWDDEIDVKLISPSGTEVVLHDQQQHPSPYVRHIVGTYPTTLTPDGNLADFVGENGNGDWKLNVFYDWSTSTTYNSFTLNLYCN